MTAEPQLVAMLNGQSATPGQSYCWNETWTCLPSPAGQEPLGRTHGIAVSQRGHIYIFRQGNPAVIVCEPGGRVVDSWGDYPGAHGLTLVEEGDEEFLWLTDERKIAVEKLTLTGKVISRIEPPPYAASETYIPTWVGVNELHRGGNGDIWVADGYGSSRVSRFDIAGKFILTLNGEEGFGRFNCPHGIWFDSRKRIMELYVADRGNQRAQVYSADGAYLRCFGEDFFTSPDGFCANGDHLLIPELQGRLTVLDASDRLIGHIGDNERVCGNSAWPDGTPLEPGKFNSPHAATVDKAGNIYIVEWRVGGRVIKLERC